MSNKEVIKIPPINTSVEPVIVDAEPEPLEIDLRRTAVIVIDMQNAFVTKGGMFDLMGVDKSLAREIIEPIKEINGTARTKGVKVIYSAHCLSPDLHDAGGPDSGYWYKENALKISRKHPEWRDKLLFRDTWGTDIVEELSPQKGDIVVEKTRFSAFFGTNLDAILKTHSIKYLIFVGTATNICVEASIRDACYLGYYPILISDASANAGSSITQEATIFNVKLCHGWVTTSKKLIEAMR